MKNDDFLQLDESWDTLKNSIYPVCIYGTGNACERMLEQFSQRGITCSGIFASDSFVRDRSFCGYKVESLTELENRFGEITVCVAFGSSLADVMDNIRRIASRHKLVFPDLPVAGDEIFSKTGLLERFDKAEKLYNLLADNRSKAVLENVLKFKLSGEIAILENIFSDISLDAKELLNPQSNEVYADLGGYNGDTAENFIEAAGGSYERIYILEPDKRSFRKCVKRLISHDNIIFANACAWSHDTQLRFGQSAGRQSKLGSGDLMAVRSLDSLLDGKCCSIIKLDVEGAESAALDGCAKTIAEYKPKMAVSVYHRAYDIIDLPLKIYGMKSDYKIYLRQARYFPAWDTIAFFC